MPESRLVLLLPLVACLFPAVESTHSFLHSLSFYDGLRYRNNDNGRINETANNNVIDESSIIVSSVEREGNLDVIHLEQQAAEGAVNTSISVCHMATLLPLSTIDPTDDDVRLPYTTLGSMQGVAALMLGLSHLNEADGSIVPEISQVKAKCPNLKFTTELLDSQLDERKAIDSVIGMVSRESPSKQPLPCAFVGSYRSAATIPTSIITGLQGYPQLAALSTSSALDDRDQFPLAGRLNPSDDGTAVAAILYLHSHLGVSHLAVVHTNDAYGTAYVNGLIQAAAELAPSMIIESVDLPFHLSKASPDTLKHRVKKLKDTGFRYFFGIIFDAVHYDPFMTEAVEQGIAGTGEHQWIFSDGVGVGRMVQRKYERNSPLFKATKGTGMITAVGGLPSTNNSPYDRLASAMKQLQENTDDLAYISSKLPYYADHPDFDATALVIEHPEFLQEPGLLAPFLYDTVVAIGLAACASIAEEELPLVGEEHFRRIVQSNFQGTSGHIDIDPETGTRRAHSALFSLTNFVQDGEDSDDNSQVHIKAVVTNFFKDGDWTAVEPYIYNDGTTKVPLDLPRSNADPNFISTAARILILFLGTSSVALSLIFALWTKMHSSDRVVKASQPIFLFIICAGTGLMGSSILLLVVDDGIMQETSCQIACLVFPWLVSMGFSLTASALFTKTHRINVIVNQRQFRRIAVSPLDVMKPMFCLVGVNTITLIVWNVVDTADWTRETILYDTYGRPAESIGFCAYEDSLPYLLVLAVANVGAILYACYEAYIARDVSTEFAESEYIFKSMAIVLLVFFVGIPVTIMTEDNTTARSCVMAGTIYACSLAFQLTIFIPKIKFNSKVVRDDRQSSVFKRDTHRTSEDNSTSLNVDSESSGETFGMKVINRQLIQCQLEAENKRLRKKNKILARRIQYLRGGDGSGGKEEEGADEGELTRNISRRSLRSFGGLSNDSFNGSLSGMSNYSMTSTGRPLKFVSDQESTIEIDPLEHSDESELEVAPF